MHKSFKLIQNFDRRNGFPKERNSGSANERSRSTLVCRSKTEIFRGDLSIMERTTSRGGVLGVVEST
jgi:hypothetical protein